jgi:hypothetical protein
VVRVNIEKELFELCEDMITILHNLKVCGKITEEQYNEHMEVKLVFMNQFSKKQG